MNISRALLLGGTLLLTAGLAQAQPLTLKQDHPSHYTVRKGDTLWDISAHFLNSPWHWPKLWHANPQVANPHLIYPGDRLTLIWVNGEPRLVREGSVLANEVRLSPRMRAEPAVPSIPLAAIMDYTGNHELRSPSALEGMPVLLGDQQGRTLLRQDAAAFVRGELVPGELYGVYRSGEVLRNDIDDSELARRLMLVGTVLAEGRPVDGISRVRISSLRRDMRPGDRLLSLDPQSALAAFYHPRPGPGLNHGRVLAMGHEGSIAMRHEVVFINKGSLDGVRAGDLYGVLRESAAIDTAALEEAGFWRRSAASELPPLPVARIMVFRAYDRVSAALVLDSREPVQRHYLLGEPSYDEHGL
ncbi:LysM peptidoglycan-binding domain-containing protein [Oceanimonas sp. NS1]|uniref:LysM peptidoglycan-binding domain-containing protein n=1 Tax=Oceanimonas TaxID=129577 RepID=UPI0013F663A6|nr:LysM peptidoglycan-binding domain-containing protein [Oceanimonas doudoroffii]MCT7654070.1 LysM peptidoglycan-binding domain-containing protein [Oceanimonas sp. NS1]